ncbi:MAG: nucleotidyltransferase family protein [Erythrobacter sp.]|nr:nucleotidyltransferase family protein [Erythrobacter sp.]
MNIAALDEYLARCVSSILRAEQVPPWPAECSGDADGAARRIAFHGIALLIAQAPAAVATWPPVLARPVRAQAGMQSFWEDSHRAAIAPLLEAFAAADIRAIVTKGTALAYSAYHDPAMRKRGDTDIFVPGARRKQVRQVLRSCGWREAGDTKALQESWLCETAIGFTPTVDIHWRINASAAASRMIETGLRFDETIALERLSPRARAIGPVDNLILIAINRAAHGLFGYHVGADEVFETDRLIWAVDTHLLTGIFGARDWQALGERAAPTGTQAMVHNSLAFAQRTLGTAVPEAVADAMAHAPENHGVAAYFGSSSHLWRLRRDLAACTGLDEKARVFRYAAFPDDAFLLARFPDADGWPRPALHLRRWAEGIGKLLIGKR